MRGVKVEVEAEAKAEARQKKQRKKKQAGKKGIRQNSRGMLEQEQPKKQKYFVYTEAEAKAEWLKEMETKKLNSLKEVQKQKHEVAA